jgi:hypothetical protein
MDSVRWVDDPSYVGLDRRDRDTLRLRERRRRENAGPLPPLSHALRHLRVRVHDTVTLEGLQKFEARVGAVSRLADARGHSELRDLLVRLARDLAYAPDDPRETIYSELDKAEALAIED